MAKTLRVGIVRGDREAWDGGDLRLKITDLHQGLTVLYDEPHPGTEQDGGSLDAVISYASRAARKSKQMT